ncbi:MAG: class I SAM-dependent methyltransferase [Gammaproteobacteria bacterium]|nr:class I SAM-dependent methyltransferase [Gammaproteobacteria bacterium]MXY58893.1 class I SAM-dependent methyltransferase [Gammaproteobacteria bacterium]MYF28059.1 class I SAM-dependent methyltransferase [Gammaproteobacteria bacterium]MYK46986.1 class I SAM-dependent methyltransferase [Gammaproteobacteria bacterium]
MDKTVDFGAERVTPTEKTRRVGGVFDAVVDRYDAMNDIMSLGTHRLFKRVAVEMARLRAGHRVLDLAGGTGDMTALTAPLVGETGRVVLADINGAMLTRGRDRLLDHGFANFTAVQARAESLPFPDGCFDAVIVAFGVRNFTDKEAGLKEMHRVLRTAGTAVVLEFSRIQNRLLGKAYDAFRATWPIIGTAVAGAAAPYRYLVESIDRHPDQGAFRSMMVETGFVDVEVHNLAAGAAAIHRGVK